MTKVAGRVIGTEPSIGGTTVSERRTSPVEHYRLVGREAEQQSLRQAFQRASGGVGQTVLIGGEAGIGKTALVEAFVRDVRDAGAMVLGGACYDVTRTPAYGPWTEAFEPADGKDLQVSDPSLWFDTERLNTFEGQDAFFREIRDRLIADALDVPLVIVLEDLHWSDQESLDLLRYLSRSIDQARVLLVCTYRDDERMAGRPLFKVLPNLIREAQPERVEPQRFDIDTVRQLIDQQYGLTSSNRDRLATGLQHRTEGNPFFVTEMLRALELAGALTRGDTGWKLGSLAEVGVPSLIRQVIDRRFQRLDEETQSALQTAAVLGYEIQPDMWLSVTDLDEKELAHIVQVALEEGLLEEAPQHDQLRFRHALVRETLYASLALPWRRIRHREIAEKIAERNVDPSIVASHFQLAGDSRAPGWQLKAARRARHHYAPNSVIEHVDAAVSGENELSPEERMEAHRLRGWAHEVSGAFGVARDDYQQSLRLARTLHRAEEEWDALMRLGELWAGRDYERAGQYVQQAHDLARDMGDQALLAHSLNRLGNWHLNDENPDQAREYHDQALETFQTIGDQPGIAATYDLLGMTCVLGGNLVDGVRHYERAIDLFQTLDNRQGLSSSLANASHGSLSYLSETMVSARSTLDECIAITERALEIASEIDYRAGEVFALMRLCTCLGPRGEYQRALDVLQRGIAGAEAIDHRQWLSATHSVGGLLYLDLLDPEPARSHMERAVTIAEEIGSSHWIRCNTGIIAMAYLAMGELDEAAQVLGPTWVDDLPARTMAQRQVWCARIELELLRGEPELALQFVDQVLEATPYASVDRPPIRLALLKAQALIESGRHDEAAPWLSSARAAARAQGALPFLWRIHRLIGIMHQRGGRRLPAAGQFAEARRIIEEIATTIDDLDYRLRFRAAALEQIPDSWAPTELQAAKGTFGGLTRRQREVAALIAAGSSNQEIANHLSIGERTVESHVSAIFSTLGLDSRAQVASWAMEHGLVSRSSASPDH